MFDFEIVVGDVVAHPTFSIFFFPSATQARGYITKTDMAATITFRSLVVFLQFFRFALLQFFP